jgi:hypothetical protein
MMSAVGDGTSISMGGLRGERSGLCRGNQRAAHTELPPAHEQSPIRRSAGAQFEEWKLACLSKAARMRLELEARAGGGTLDHPCKAGGREWEAALADENKG